MARELLELRSKLDAYRRLDNGQLAQLAFYQKEDRRDHAARATLESEREANARLTEENESLRAENAHLRQRCAWLQERRAVLRKLVASRWSKRREVRRLRAKLAEQRAGE